jgi:hypothetical protein
MWSAWSRRGPYEPEFWDLSRDRPGSRQNRDTIGPRHGDLVAAHLPIGGLEVGHGRQPLGRIRSTLPPMSRYLSELALRSARSESAGSDGSSIGRRHQSGMVNENSEVRVEALRRSHAAATPRSFRHIADLRFLLFHHHLPAREPTHHPLPAPSAQAQGARHAPRIRSEGATAGDHTRAGSGTHPAARSSWARLLTYDCWSAPAHDAARGVLAAATPLVRSVRRRRGGAGCWPSRGAVDRRRRDVERPRAMGPRRRGGVGRRAELLTDARRCWASSPRRWSAPHDGAAEARVLAGAELLVVAAAAPLSDPSDRRAELLVGAAGLAVILGSSSVLKSIRAAGVAAALAAALRLSRARRRPATRRPACRPR